MEIKILSPEQIAFKEKDIQTSFEKDLTKLEEGLELDASEVTIGAGRIDTLAYDSESGRPVFIEYKRRGEFDKDVVLKDALGPVSTKPSPAPNGRSGTSIASV